MYEGTNTSPFKVVKGSGAPRNFAKDGAES